MFAGWKTCKNSVDFHQSPVGKKIDNFTFSLSVTNNNDRFKRGYI